MERRAPEAQRPPAGPLAGAEAAEVLGRARHDVGAQHDLDAAERRAVRLDVEEDDGVERGGGLRLALRLSRLGRLGPAALGLLPLRGLLRLGRLGRLGPAALGLLPLRGLLRLEALASGHLGPQALGLLPLRGLLRLEALASGHLGPQALGLRLLRGLLRLEALASGHLGPQALGLLPLRVLLRLEALASGRLRGNHLGLQALDIPPAPLLRRLELVLGRLQLQGERRGLCIELAHARRLALLGCRAAGARACADARARRCRRRRPRPAASRAARCFDHDRGGDVADVLDPRLEHDLLVRHRGQRSDRRRLARLGGFHARLERCQLGLGGVGLSSGRFGG